MVELCHGDGHAGRARRVLQAFDAEDQAGITRPAQLVRLDQPGFEGRTSRLDRRLRLLLPHGRLGNLTADRLHLFIGLSGLREPQIPLDFEATKIHEERTLLARQRIRFLLKGGDPLVRACCRLGGRSRRLLRAQAGGHAAGSSEAEHERRRTKGRLHGGIVDELRS